jgi:hypothetical protein
MGKGEMCMSGLCMHALSPRKVCIICEQLVNEREIITDDVVDLLCTARVTIENFWARSGRELGENWARTFTNFDRGTVHFRHMGVLVSRICTIFYVESVLKIFAIFTVIRYVSNMYERIYLDQS